MPVTTLVLKIARKLRYDDLLLELRRLCAAAVPRVTGPFDLVHLPWKKLAVVNFISEQVCQRCWSCFSGLIGRSCLLNGLRVASCQGLANNLALWSARAEGQRQLNQPRIFYHGREVALPRACIALQTVPRLEHVEPSSSSYASLGEFGPGEMADFRMLEDLPPAQIGPGGILIFEL